MKVIYMIINLTNGKKYIGSTTNFSRRKNEHLNQLKKDKHHCIHLQKSYNKYGIDFFKIIVLKKVSENEDILFYEQYFIDLYQSYKREYGYNMFKDVKQIGGKNKIPVYRFSLDGKFIEKYESCTNAAYLLKHSVAGIAKCARLRNRPFKNEIWSYEEILTEDRIKLANIIIPVSGIIKRKTILQYDIYGNFIKEWSHIREISKEYNCSVTKIRNVILHVTNNINGFTFKFKDN